MKLNKVRSAMIRPYQNTDKEKLLELFRLNTPQYFDPSEEEGYLGYLDHEFEYYFVAEENGEIVGAGGYNYSHDRKEAHICWDIIHPDYQGKGLGKELTQYRISEIKKGPPVDLIVVRTSQLTYRFYEKMGFELIRKEKDYWAPGFDLYHMRLAFQGSQNQYKK